MKQTVFYNLQLPNDLLNIIEREFESNKESIQNEKEESKISVGNINHNIRSSKTTWISNNNWISGLIMHYVNLSNKDNFLYDINPHIEDLQYTVYNVGDHYRWHTDSSNQDLYSPGISNMHFLPNKEEERSIDFIKSSINSLRKLSFSLQLSDHDEYSGGNLQLMNENDELYVAPRIKGSLLIFDSRVRHRVTRVVEGTRKSLVGWIHGPRWR